MSFIPRGSRDGISSTVAPLGQQRRDGLVFGVSIAPSILVTPSESSANFIDPRHDIRCSRLDRAAIFMDVRAAKLANDEAIKRAAAVESPGTPSDSNPTSTPAPTAE